MKTNTLRWLGVSATAAAAVLCWYLLSMEPDSPPRTEVKKLASATSVVGKQPAAEPAEPPPEPSVQEINVPSPEHGPSFLTSGGRDAAGLIAAWDMTGNIALLMEAAEKFPGDPRVSMAMIQHAGDDAEKAMPWIEKLIAAEPANPQGLYHKAWALMARKDRAGAIAALRQAAALPGPRDTHLADRMLTVREAAVAGGATRAEAARQALAISRRHRIYSSQSLTGSANAISQELAAVQAAGREDRLMEIAGIGLATAKNYPSGGAAFLWDALEAVKLEMTILSALPDDTDLGDGGQSAASRRSELYTLNADLRASLAHVATVRTLLKDASDDVMWTYVEHFAQRGEPEATAWLLSQAGWTK